MINSKSLFVLFTLSLLFSALIAQGQNTGAALSLDKSPVEDQFKYVYKKSNDFEEFKMIKRWHFSRLKSHVLDTINNLKLDLISSNLVIDSRDITIDSLITANSTVHSKLDAAILEKESLSWLGMDMKKGAYNSLVWTIIAILAAGITTVFMLYNRSNIITIANRKDLAEVRMEFEAFRKRALEREEGIVRKFHNELNKYKAKAGKLS